MILEVWTFRPPGGRAERERKLTGGIPGTGSKDKAKAKQAGQTELNGLREKMKKALNERYKAVYVRVVAKTGIKMKAAVAIQRKLLELAFTIYKNQLAFDPNYFETKRVTT